jgi:hypothetical protein
MDWRLAFSKSFGLNPKCLNAHVLSRESRLLHAWRLQHGFKSRPGTPCFPKSLFCSPPRVRLGYDMGCSHLLRLGNAPQRSGRLGGLIIDVLIAFGVKLLLRIKRGWGSGNWELVKAKIKRSSVGGGWVWNCPTTEIVYTYKFNGETYSIVDTKPFLLDESAKAYVEHFRTGDTRLVRVKAEEPERSILRKSDQ